MKIDKSMDKYFYITGWIVIGLFLVGVLVLKITGLTISEVVPPCALWAVTGYYCPGCGGTRAAMYFLKGNLIKSFLYHPFVLYAVVFGGWFMISQTIERVSKNRIQIAMHYRNIYLWMALIIAVLNCVVKNLPILLWDIHLMG